MQVWLGMWNIGNLGGDGGFCDALRKGMIDMCCLQRVRYRELGFGTLGMEGMTYNLW